MSPNTSKTIARFEQAWQELAGNDASAGTVKPNLLSLSATLPNNDRPGITPDRISEPKPTHIPHSSPTASRQFPRGARVLVVDDMRIVRDTVAQMARSLGLETACALTAAEAFAAIADPESRLDLIVTDLMMPDIDGQDLIAAIRETRPNVPAILTSGCFDTLSISGAGTREPNPAPVELLPKPFSLAQLRDLTLKLIGVPALGQPVAPAALAA